ncbi:MAG: Binding-protein-dependent transport systems inner membrane component [Thermotoga sp. 50_1627]|nr:MAG: Binding-protein-dependent transport systems inner membrane component [Thermotoga sp. 50_64]KUK24582.1 MAG: Binding-protein-dependent transport systems inner membrane component [Thermotoga sp. 50_1627]MBC7122003.1 carbohydrate ABC transporter permease [Pseudothermotoga sp.]HBT39425.1 sugar ABC transporter permease [Pseudothermotoga sp.]HCO97182.1 sugar ABC transporter permease [Pseudothermotoga sp.]
MRSQNRWAVFMKYLLTIPACAFTLLPLIWVVVRSIEPDTGIESYSLLPKAVTFDNYLLAWNYPKVINEKVTLGTMLFNSLLVASVVTLVSIIFDSMAGYALARKNFVGKKLLFWLALSTLMIPFYAIAIPMYIIVIRMGMYDSLLSLIIPFTASGFGVFMFRQSFLSIPADFEQAARADGANDFYIYWRIMLPMVKPTVATMIVFKVLWSWGQFFWPLLVIQDYSKMPINLGLAMFRGHNITRWGLLCAGMVVATIPILVLFLACQKWYVEGLSGGLKG